MYKVAIVTVSDKCFAKEREDKSKLAIEEIINATKFENKFIVSDYFLVPDEKDDLKKVLLDLCDIKNIPLIITTGGTGFSKRDITPDVTKEVIQKEAPGIAEAMRYNSMMITKRAMLSRAIAGIRNDSLIINLPGSPKAVTENLEYIINDIHHAIEILLGTSGECARL